MLFSHYKRAISLILAILVLIPTMMALAQATTQPVDAAGDTQQLSVTTRTVYVTSQRFERGQMYWASDTGTIYVLYDDGRADIFPISAYGTLPEGTNVAPPNGRIRPLFGFGRVWGNFAAVREGLGWAIWPEIGFTTDITTQDSVVYIKQFNVVPVKITDGTVWEQVVDGKIPGEEVTLSVMVSPQTVKPDEEFTVTWAMSGASYVLVEVRDLRIEDKMFYWVDGLSNSGQQSFTMPVDAFDGVQVDVFAYRYVSNGSSPSLMERLKQRTFTITQDASTSAQTQAAYQPYENGFMIWRADTGTIMMFVNGGSMWREFTEVSYASYPNNPVTDPVPAGKVKPVSGFGRVWGNSPDVRETLGWATAPETAYRLTASESPDGIAEFTLPDGRTVTVYGYGWKYNN